MDNVALVFGGAARALRVVLMKKGEGQSELLWLVSISMWRCSYNPYSHSVGLYPLPVGEAKQCRISNKSSIMDIHYVC